VQPSEFFSKIKLGYAFVGKIGYLLTSIVVGATALSIFLVENDQPELAVAVWLVSLGVGGWGAYRMFGLVEKNPIAALTEGVEFVKAYQIEQAAKDPRLIEGKVEVSANTSPPLAISSGGEDR
jgi:hypothetical protein